MKNLFRSVYYFLFKKHPLVFLGKILSVLLPSYYNNVIPDYFYQPSTGLVDRSFRLYFADKYYSWPLPKRLDFNRQYLWGGSSGRNYIQSLDTRVESGGQSLIDTKLSLIPRIAEVASWFHLENIYETGTGQGLFLSFI